MAVAILVAWLSSLRLLRQSLFALLGELERGSRAAHRTAQQQCVGLHGKTKLESQDPRIVA